MLSMIVVKIVGAIFKIPLLNVLHESGMAYFSAAYTLFTAVYALTVTGLSAAVARMVAENHTRGRYRDVRKILKVSNLIFIVLGSVGFVFILLFSKNFAEFIKSPNSYYALLMISPAILFCCMMASYRGYYEGLSDMIPTAITQIIEVVVKLIAGLSFASLVMNIGIGQFKSTGKVFGVVCSSLETAISSTIPFAAAGAMLGVSVSTLFGFLYIFVRYRLRGDFITKEELKLAPPAKRSTVLVYKLIKISIPITLGAVVLQLSAMIDMITVMDKLSAAYASNPSIFNTMYGAYLKQGEVMHEFLYGAFNASLTIFNLVPALTNIFGKSALPNVTNAWIEKDKSKIKVNIESVIRVTTLIAAPAGIGIAFMSKPILMLLYGGLEGTINVGTPLLMVFGIGAMFLSLVTPMNAIMQGIGRNDLPVKILFIGAGLKLALNLILIGIPQVNVMGAAISTLACYSLIGFLSISKLRKIAGVKLDLKGILIKPVFSGIICGITALVSYNILTIFSQSKFMTVLSIGIGGIFYVISLILTNAISKDDVLMLPRGEKFAKTLAKYKIIR